MRRFRFFAAGLSSVSSVLGRFVVITSSVCTAATAYSKLLAIVPGISALQSVDSSHADAGQNQVGSGSF